MRKSIIPVSFAIVAALSLPAQAAKFNCVFYGTGIPPTSGCPIDSSDATKICEHQFPGNVKSTCFGGGNLIRCVFHTDRLPADFQKDIDTSGPVPLVAAPGMLAGGLAEASTKLLLGAYKESRATPEFDAQCRLQP